MEDYSKTSPASPEPVNSYDKAHGSYKETVTPGEPSLPTKEFPKAPDPNPFQLGGK